jgi:hypothetical protein
MCQNPAEVYLKSLESSSDGRPLYYPEPDDNLPNALKNKGYGIGDVVAFDGRGGVYFLFNITRRAGHPINQNGVPEGFKPVSLKKKDVQTIKNAYSPRSHVASCSDRSRRFSVDVSYKEYPFV